MVAALIGAMGIVVWTVFTLVGEVLGAAFVPTDQREIDEVLKVMGLKPGKTFFDLGSGDGRVVRTAVEKYGVNGIGIEINPWLILWSKLKTENGNPNFLRKNFWRMNLGKADYIYFYLGPMAAKKLAKKLTKECKPGTLVISKAFEMNELKKYLIKTWLARNKKYFMYKVQSEQTV